MSRKVIINPERDAGPYVKAAVLQNTGSHNDNYTEIYDGLAGIPYELRPESHGYQAWTFCPTSTQYSNVALVSGQVLANRVWVPKTITITGIDAYLGSQALANPTPGAENRVALYGATGTLIAGALTDDQSTAWGQNPDSVHRMPFPEPVEIGGGSGQFIYVVMIGNATTMPYFYQLSATAGLFNAGLGAGTYHALSLSSEVVLSAETGWLFAGAIKTSRIMWYGLY